VSTHLVLGGGGFIGHHLGRKLKEMGEEVILADVKWEPFRDYDGAGHFQVWVDLRDRGLTNSLISYWKPAVVWQLAADMGGVEYFHSDHDWAAAVDNQLINVNVMNAVAQHSPESRVVFTSTACALATEAQTHKYAAEWGGHDLKPEDIEWGTPDQLYGQEKRNSALLWSRSPLDTRVCFLHTVYGPGQEHAGIRMKFPSAIVQKARAARETGKIEVFGDGRQVRTFLYIDDALKYLIALGYSDEDPGFINIGGVIPYSVDQVTRVAGYAAGLAPGEDYEVYHQLDKPTGVEHRGCDMSKTFQQFGSLSTTSLMSGLVNMVAWLDELEGQNG